MESYRHDQTYGCNDGFVMYYSYGVFPIQFCLIIFTFYNTVDGKSYVRQPGYPMDQDHSVLLNPVTTPIMFIQQVEQV